jgi:hypothetical protein
MLSSWVQLQTRKSLAQPQFVNPSAAGTPTLAEPGVVVGRSGAGEPSIHPHIDPQNMIPSSCLYLEE